MSYESLTIQKIFFKRLFSSLLFMVSFISFGYATDPIPIDINSSVNGDLATATHISPLSHNHSQVYTFTLTRKTNIVIDLKMPDYYWGKLYLLDSNNSIVGETPNDFLSSNKIIGIFKAGTYCIDVTTSEPSASLEMTQNFALSLKENIIQNSVIQLDSITDGALSASSGISPRSKHRAHYYTFTLTEKKDVAITLDAAYYKQIYLLDANETVAAQDYGHKTIIKSLDAGTYTIDATTNNQNVTGIYTLYLKENIISNTDISLDRYIKDEWNLSSGFSPQSKRHTNYYTFELFETTDVLIRLFEHNDEKLYLLDHVGRIIYPEGLESFNTDMIFTTLDAGIYTIDATTKGYGNNDIGSYLLQVRKNHVEISPIGLNKSINNKWTKFSGFSPIVKSYSHYYTFTLSEKKNISIQIESNVVSTAYLLDANGSLISPIGDKKIITTLQPGTYTIGASMLGYNQFGNYTLSLRENAVLSDYAWLVPAVYCPVLLSN